MARTLQNGCSYNIILCLSKQDQYSNYHKIMYIIILWFLQIETTYEKYTCTGFTVI